MKTSHLRRAKLIPLVSCTVVAAFLAAVCAATYTVGVKPGDWAEFGDISATWESTDPEAKMPPQMEGGGPVGWSKAEVTDVTGTNVRLEITQRFRNGTEMKGQIEGNLGANVGDLGFFLYPGALGKGDSLPGGGPVNETIIRRYAGAEREVNLLNYTTSLFGANTTSQIFFDKATGILCEHSVVVIAKHNGYITTSSSTMRITETNLWQRTEIGELPGVIGLLALLATCCIWRDRWGRPGVRPLPHTRASICRCHSQIERARWDETQQR